MAIRDIILFLIVFGAVPLTILHPSVGIMLWAWLGLMNPHRFTWGAAFSFPFAFIAAIATFAGLLFTKDERRWKGAPEVYVLIALAAWMSLTTLFALEPAAAQDMWTRTMKILLMSFLGLIVLHSREHIERMVWVLALSVGLFGVKGGLFTVLTRGEGRVWGPPYSFIEDNNALALALVMTIPLIYFLFMRYERLWMKAGFAVAMILCAFSVLGSYSRGALLAVGAMSAFLWLKSPHKLLLGAILVIGAPFLLAFMPEHWHERMQSIGTYQEDSSAMGRIYAWTLLTDLARERFFGGGFEPYSRELYDKYVPESPQVHSAHSIYFQMLGEHGFVGLALFLLVWFFTWLSMRRIIRATQDRPELRWAYSLTLMIQVSLIGYLVGGVFLNLAYWDLPYYLMVLVVVLRHYVLQPDAQRADAAQPAPRAVMGERQGTGVGDTAH